MGQCLRSQYVWWTRKTITQLDLPNYSSLMGEWTVLSHQQNQAATKQKQGKALDFMACGTSRLEHCGRSHEGPIQTSGVCIHKYAWARISNFPHMKTGSRWCQPQVFPTQCPPPSMGTPLVLQQVTLVSPWCQLQQLWTDKMGLNNPKNMGFGISEWLHGLANTLDSESAAPGWEVKKESRNHQLGWI